VPGSSTVVSVAPHCRAASLTRFRQADGLLLRACVGYILADAIVGQHHAVRSGIGLDRKAMEAAGTVFGTAPVNPLLGSIPVVGLDAWYPQGTSCIEIREECERPAVRVSNA
jgi:hypothetical protein